MFLYDLLIIIIIYSASAHLHRICYYYYNYHYYRAVSTGTTSLLIITILNSFNIFCLPLQPRHGALFHHFKLLNKRAMVLNNVVYIGSFQDLNVPIWKCEYESYVFFYVGLTDLINNKCKLTI